MLSAGRLARWKGQQKLVLVRNSGGSFLVSGCRVKLAARINFFLFIERPPWRHTERMSGELLAGCESPRTLYSHIQLLFYSAQRSRETVPFYSPSRARWKHGKEVMCASAPRSAAPSGWFGSCPGTPTLGPFNSNSGRSLSSRVDLFSYKIQCFKTSVNVQPWQSWAFSWPQS